MIPEPQPLLIFSVLLLAGVLAGRLAHRIRLPHVTGQILVGILLGHSVLNLFPSDSLEGLQTITQFALGFIALTIGEHLNLRAMRNMGRRLVFLLIAESILVPICVIAAATPVAGGFWLPVLLTQAERHKQVRAGLERWIRRSPEVQQQLYRAESPAHAHDLLHAEESEGFNYYLTAD